MVLAKRVRPRLGEGHPATLRSSPRRRGEQLRPQPAYSSATRPFAASQSVLPTPNRMFCTPLGMNTIQPMDARIRRSVAGRRPRYQLGELLCVTHSRAARRADACLLGEQLRGSRCEEVVSHLCPMTRRFRSSRSGLETPVQLAHASL
jgi:hypothetical protein